MKTEGATRRILDWVFGYDFFICHRQSDGKDYARALAEALKNHPRRFDVFIDLKEYIAGDNIAAMQTRALNKTARLIVIATPEVHDSPWALGEIQEFKRYKKGVPGRLIVPIGTPLTLAAERYPKSDLLKLIPSYPDSLCLLDDVEGPLKVPSAAVIEKLANDFNLIQSGVRRARMLRWLTLVFAVLAVSSGALAWLANERRQQVTEQLSQASVAEAVHFVDADDGALALAHLAHALKINPDNASARCRLTTLLTERTFALPKEIRSVSLIYPEPPDPTTEWTAVSSNGKLAAVVDEKAAVIHSLVDAAIVHTLYPRLPMPYGTTFHSVFDDRAKWLAVSANSRTGTYARIWSVQQESMGLPVVEKFCMESRSDRLALISSLDSKNNPSQILMGLEPVGEDGASSNTRGILWEVGDGVYRPDWKEVTPREGARKKSDVEALSNLKSLGWAMRESGDESPFVLVGKDGSEKKLDHGGYANSYGRDVSRSGKNIATAGEDKMAKLWRVKKGGVTSGLSLEHPNSVWYVRFSPDEQFLLTATGSGSSRSNSELRVFEVASGRLLAGPWKISGTFETADFSADQTFVWCQTSPDDEDGSPDAGGVSISEARWPLSVGPDCDITPLAKMAEALGGWRVLDSGAVTMIPLEERLQVLKETREAVDAARSPEGERLLKWIFADRIQRSPDLLFGEQARH